MKSMFATIRMCHGLTMTIAFFLFIMSCSEHSLKQKNSASIHTDSSSMVSDEDSSKENHANRSPASIPEEDSVAKGVALVYCPTKMIRNVPSIVNAAISREDLAKALSIFQGTVHLENPEATPEDIAKDTRSDTIDLYKRMEVEIEFDPDDFGQIGEDDEPIKEFGNKNMLEWEWELKPKHITRKSIIHFKFYYVYPNNKKSFIRKKEINIAVSVDARSYLEKLGDYFFDDFKSGLTTVLIPLVTFLGGFLSGKRKKN